MKDDDMKDTPIRSLQSIFASDIPLHFLPFGPLSENRPKLRELVPFNSSSALAVLRQRGSNLLSNSHNQNISQSSIKFTVRGGSLARADSWVQSMITPRGLDQSLDLNQPYSSVESQEPPLFQSSATNHKDQQDISIITNSTMVDVSIDSMIISSQDFRDSAMILPDEVPSQSNVRPKILNKKHKKKEKNKKDVVLMTNKRWGSFFGSTQSNKRKKIAPLRRVPGVCASFLQVKEPHEIFTEFGITRSFSSNSVDIDNPMEKKQKQLISICIPNPNSCSNSWMPSRKSISGRLSKERERE